MCAVNYENKNQSCSEHQISILLISSFSCVGRHICNTDDNIFKQSAYNFLSNNKKNQGDYRAALNYKEKQELILELLTLLGQKVKYKKLTFVKL